LESLVHPQDRMTETTTVSQYLSADHARLDKIFADTRRLADAGEWLPARAAFEPFAQGLTHHIAVEEQRLFPVFEARLRTAGPTTVMRLEHRSIEQLLARLRAALDGSDGAAFGDAAAELGRIIEVHNRKEEHVLYPRLDAALDVAERNQLVAAMRSA
jgi:hemerythrin-like domain-containing protein